MPEQTPSKTRRKKEMLALQELGVELVGLADEQLAALDLPEVLRDAIEQARHITGFEARRRQLQYIGKLMRGVDPAPIQAVLAAQRAGARRQSAALRRAEAWRERLLSDPDALAKLLGDYPGADGARLHTLIESARRERARAQSPHSSRELFRVLRSLLAEERDP